MGLQPGSTQRGRSASSDAEQPRVALLLPTLAVGGAERNFVALAGELQRSGHAVELVVLDARGPLRDAIPDGVRVIDLGARRARTALPALVRYLRASPPACLVVTVEHASVLALLARATVGGTTRVVVRVATTLRGLTSWHQPSLTVLLARLLYPRADALVTNSTGAADELADFLHIDRSRVEVLPNLTVGPAVLAGGPPSDHPWFTDADVPVIVSVGRLDPLKNLPLLIEAFVLVRQRRRARLVLVGGGSDRDRLEALVARWGIEADVAFLGHHPDPTPYLRAARVYCLASNAEGMPNAMIEAMACGTGVVSTDCPNGPRDLLQGGRYGRLVPMGDRRALAAALLESLDDPRPAPPEAWEAHTVEAAGAAYATFLAGVITARR